MEQKRILWIALASGFFLLVVVGAAALYFRSSNQAPSIQDTNVWTAPPITQNQGTKEAEPYSPGIASATAPAETSGITQTDSLTVIASGTTNIYGVAGVEDKSTTTTIDLNTLKNYSSEEQTQSTPQTVTAQNQAASDAIKAAQTSSAPQASSQASSSAGTASTKTTISGTTASSAKSTSSSSSAAKSSSSASQAAASTKPADRFWVQAASYSNKKNADEAREILDKNGLQCEVFTYTDSKNTLFYRVRVGPYTTKSEAEYWKQRIDAIDFFAGSATYITNSSAPAVK